MRRVIPLALLGAVLLSGVVQAQEAVTVRVTYYLPTGHPMYSGPMPYRGAAACSWGWPLGTRLRFADDGREVVCADRGRLPNGRTWVDVYVSSDAEGRETVARRYGTHTVVEEVE